MTNAFALATVSPAAFSLSTPPACAASAGRNSADAQIRGAPAAAASEAAAATAVAAESALEEERAAGIGGTVERKKKKEEEK